MKQKLANSEIERAIVIPAPESRILVVEDEPAYQRLIRFNLETKGYAVACVASGEEALTFIAEQMPDLVMLDIMLPGMDGFEVCKRIREVTHSVCIIMLTAKNTAQDKVKGLELGADDYLAKPFSAPEMLARVGAVLRRAQQHEAPHGQTVIKVDGLEIDLLRRRVTIDGLEMPLSPTEYRLLHCLAANAGTVLTHDYLLEQVWGAGYSGLHEMLRVTLWRLRQKMEKDPSNPRYIITYPGVGYVLA
ncbi:MAG: response regulator transcription factor [Chloroflexi bacterium]|nr:response regulator transcription factor [Chloroflexota bacterium]